jgi:hypothetical protein
MWSQDALGCKALTGYILSLPVISSSFNHQHWRTTALHVLSGGMALRELLTGKEGLLTQPVTISKAIPLIKGFALFPRTNAPIDFRRRRDMRLMKREKEKTP